MIRVHYSYDWFTISLLIIGLVLILLKYLYPIKYNMFFKLLYSKSYFKTKNKETSYISTFENLVFIIANIIATQLIYIFLSQENYENLLFESVLLNLIIIFFVVSIFFLVKYHLEKLINFCFSNHKFLNIYLFYKQAIFSYSIFMALPLLVIIIYFSGMSEVLVYLMLSISGLYFVVNVLYFIYKNRTFALRNWYYFILYLCTLEIAPYYFLYNLIVVA